MRNVLLRGTVKVLVVDDSSTMRAMIVGILEKQLDFEIVGVAASAQEAQAFLDVEEPDIIALDHEMPGKTGLKWLAEIMDDQPQRVVMLSSHARDAAFCDLARAAGAKGSFDKAAIVRDSERFVEVLRRAAKRPAPANSLSADIRALRDYGLLTDVRRTAI